MLRYQTRIALKSLRRNPFLTMLLVGGIALGIGVSTTFVTGMYNFARHPIADKEGKLFYVEMDSWDPDRPYDDDQPDLPPDQMTYLDVQAIVKSPIPTYSVGMYKAVLTVHPASKDQRPFRADARMTYGDFFPMFEVPFQFGSGWDDDADAGPEPVVVLSADTNQTLFGGENSVGKTVRLEEREFTVVGVLQPWKPMPKYYDPHNGPFEDAEAIYMPLSWAEPMEIRSSGNTSGWKATGSEKYADLLNSEHVWLQMWVQLDDEASQTAFKDYLDAYALEQKKLGRFQRPLNNRLLTVQQWLDYSEVVPDEARSMLIVGLLFLIVCSVNLIGILLSKFMARAPEVGVRRALGASRAAVFVQHLIECELIGVAGGVIGIGLAFLGLRIIEGLFQTNFVFTLDANMMMVAIGMSLISALIAGAYPAWRICRIQPAIYLNTQ